MRARVAMVLVSGCLVGCEKPSSPPATTPVPTPIGVDDSRGGLVDFTTVGFADNDTFDALMEGTLQGHPVRLAIVSRIPFDGVAVPNLPPRLNAWISLWI